MFHMKSINACLSRFGADATVNLRTFRLEVRARNRYYHFVPQFIYLDGEKLHFSPQLPGNVRGFIGWLPYFNKRWPLATDKLAFKGFCNAAGLPTPRGWEKPSESVRDFIIKQRTSSFGYGIRGPFRKLDAGHPAHKIEDREYCEHFVAGTIAKAWYWNDKPVCLELRKMPTITGNGVDTMLQLASPKILSLFGLPLEHREIEALAQYQDASLDTVIPAGTTLLADFRYSSPLIQTTAQNQNVLSENLGNEIGRQFVEAGPTLWQGIPEDIRAATAFTVDAIVDDKNRVWFLEMNCNPILHPDVYLPMFETLFGPAEEGVAQPARPASLQLPEQSGQPRPSMGPPFVAQPFAPVSGGPAPVAAKL